jgi:putative CRISPR-associated protein (TIGR02619 family)
MDESLVETSGSVIQIALPDTTSIQGARTKMNRRIICTTGVSIARGIRWEEDEKQYRRAIMNRIRHIGEETDEDEGFLADVSAETKSLQALEITAQDDVHLLHTETPDGKACAEEVGKLVRDHLGSTVNLQQIEGLQVKDPRRFRRVGIKNLFQHLDRISGPSSEHKPILNVTGGFKSVVPYVTLYGLFERLDVVYIFQWADTLIHLPPMPVNFDYERLAQAREALCYFQQQDAPIPEREFWDRIPGLPYHERTFYEPLLEKGGGEMMPSSFGFLLIDRVAEEKADVYLSASAQSVYEGHQGTEKESLARLLQKVGDPLWRAAHPHPIGGTDLQVWKPGNTRERLAGYVRGNRVYVCQLWPRHDDYEREVAKRQVADFEGQGFRVWSPPEDLPDGPTAEERETTRLMEKITELESDKRQLQSQLDRRETDHLEAADKLEQKNAVLAELQEKCASQKRQIEEQSAAFDEAEKKNARLETELRDVRELAASRQAELTYWKLPWYRRWFTPHP